MAIVENFWLIDQKKRLAGAVIYQAMGQTRSRKLASTVTNPRTVDQMSQRVKWSNLVNFYRVNREWMKYAFETRTQNQSEYNKFMSVNVTGSNIYLTKQLAAQGACVVAPYTITQGSLYPIECTANAGSWSTNIMVASGFGLTENTTIASFTETLLQNNPAMRSGDQLSFIRFTQMTNADTGAPYVVVRRYEMVLNLSSVEMVASYLPLDYIGILNIGEQPQVGVIDSGNAGGFVLILSRTIGGKTYVSTQSIIVANNAATIAAYSSDAAKQAAISSYGDQSDAFLSSTSAQTDTQAPTMLSILGIYNGDRYAATGSSIMMTDWFSGGDTLSVRLNATAPAVPTSMRVITTRNTHTCTGLAADGDHVSGILPSGATFIEGEYLSTVLVTFADGTIQAVFNPASSGGIIIG